MPNASSTVQHNSFEDCVQFVLLSQIISVNSQPVMYRIAGFSVMKCQCAAEITYKPIGSRRNLGLVNA